MRLGMAHSNNGVLVTASVDDEIMDHGQQTLVKLTSCYGLSHNIVILLLTRPYHDVASWLGSQRRFNIAKMTLWLGHKNDAIPTANFLTSKKI